MEKMLVTGGTGLLGSEVVRQLLSRNLSVGVLTTQKDPELPGRVAIYRGDLRTGAGLKEALDGVRAVIHCASNFGAFDDTDIRGSTNLLNSMDASRPPHLVYISIVGVEKSTYPYYRAKRRVEETILERRTPATILRTTQFHDFVLRMIGQILDSKDEVALVPGGIRFQSVDIREVAAKLIGIADSAPAGLLPDFGGPEIHRFEDLFKDYLRVSGSRRAWKPYPVEGLRYDNFRTGVNIVPDHRAGKITWTEFLATKFQGAGG
ncbi:MAG TPA: NAD(P)H-binding protein [Puia sp.]|nr:NAD(P)H-binding protein [Puia sp.]